MLIVLSPSNLDAELWVFLFFFFLSGNWRNQVNSGLNQEYQALSSDTPTLERAVGKVIVIIQAFMGIDIKCSFMLKYTYCKSAASGSPSHFSMKTNTYYIYLTYT